MKPDFATLKHLYNTERFTTRQIGEKFGVSKTQVLRWMKSYDMQRREANNGLANRGITAPTRDELIDLVHNQHKSYYEIAQIFNVDHTAIPYWLKKLDIPRPKLWDTRYKGLKPTLPTKEELLAIYEYEQSVVVISQMFHISTWKVCKLLKEHDIEVRENGWNNGSRFLCKDGHKVRSTYEQRIDDWLYENHIPHTYEPQLPFDKRYHADFLANGWYIEIWGVQNDATYKRRRKYKTQMYQQHNLPLIEIEVHHFDKRRNNAWQRRLKVLSPENPLLTAEKPQGN